jgi:hypothetical protein
LSIIVAEKNMTTKKVTGKKAATNASKTMASRDTGNTNIGNVGLKVRIQPVDATSWPNLSAGVS